MLILIFIPNDVCVLVTWIAGWFSEGKEMGLVSVRETTRQSCQP